VHHATLMAALRRTGETFAYQEDPIPGLRRIELSDRVIFTLVPASMADHLAGAEIAAVPLADPDPPPSTATSSGATTASHRPRPS